MEMLERNLGENPWPLIFLLSLPAIGFLAQFLLTQNGRSLIRMAIVILIILLILLTDFFWKTDRERIAQVIQEMASAVGRNDEVALKKHLAPSAVYMQNGLDIGVQFESLLGKTILRQALDQMKFDYLGVRDLEITAGKKTKRGKADFRVMASGTWTPPAGGSSINFPPTPSTWSLGLTEQEDGRWLVDRITPTRLPGEIDERSNLPDLIRKKPF